MIKTIEATLSGHRITKGSSPFTRDEWVGILKLDEWLDETFKPGDKVKVTIEKVK